MSSPNEESRNFLDHPARLPEAELLKQCVITFSRASGPGGQHRNKVETAVTILHKESQIQASATERRLQSDNRRNAIFRLRLRLAIEMFSFPEKGDLPSELWKSRCQKGKIFCSPEHEDAPAMLAEVFSACLLHDFVHTDAAKTLGCSGTQLLKFLGKFPEARERFQSHRRKRGLPTLKFR